MSTSKGHLKDARGVDIKAGDTVIYGFGVSRSVAMAEGVVEAADHNGEHPWPPEDGWPVKTTPTGLVKVRVVRRSYSSGTQPVVSIMADRMVVLKRGEWAVDGVTQETRSFLPPSPLPTQDEELYDKLVSSVERYTGDIERLSTGGGLDAYERRQGYYPDYTYLDPHDPDEVARRLGMYREWEARDRRELERCCARLEKEMPV